MRECRARRRRITAASGRRYSVCGLGLVRATRPAAREPARTVGFAWVSGATLLAMLLFSAYAVERPPTFAGDQAALARVPAVSYSLSDALNALSR